MNVLFLASEMAPYIKSGGLGDIIGSLPFALKEKGVDVSIFIPKYNTLNPALTSDLTYVCSTTVFVGSISRNASIYKKVERGVTIYFIENETYFDRFGLYGFEDDIERFTFFNRSALCALEIINLKPDVIHLNDWQCGITAIYLKEKYKNFSFYKNIKSLFTIHNIQYQGVFPEHKYYCLGLDKKLFSHESFEYYNSINLLKAGLVYADAISTVSDTYSKEITTPEFGYGLDGIIREKSDVTYGILNGVDYDQINMEAEKALPPAKSTDIIELKKQRKRELQQLFNLPERDVPLLAIVSRLADQKGLNLIDEYLLNKDVQFVILGTGDGKYEQLFNYYQESMPDKFRAQLSFSVDLSYKIYAGADFFLMPSLFEPCGLGQIYAMNFGTIPIVRNTGGLADTVEHFNSETLEGNGFVFNDFVPSGLNWAVDEALKVYEDKKTFDVLVNNAKNSNFSWQKSADAYIKLYEKICAE